VDLLVALPFGSNTGRPLFVISFGRSLFLSRLDRGVVVDFGM